MKTEGWIVIPGWDKFQHRDAARSMVPTWIKVYTELMSKETFLELTFHQRGLLISLWMEYAAGKRQIRDSTVALTRRLGQRVTRLDLERLKDAGYINISASNPASNPASEVAGLEEKRVERSFAVQTSTKDVAPRTAFSNGPMGKLSDERWYLVEKILKATKGTDKNSRGVLEAFAGQVQIATLADVADRAQGHDIGWAVAALKDEARA